MEERTKRELDLTARLMSDMDPQLLEFLQTKINSFVKWDLVRFFHDNPHTADTLENIARYAGRSSEVVRHELKELVEDGVLEESQAGSMTIYSLTSDPHIRELLRRFIEASDDRQFRVKAIYHIVRGSRGNPRGARLKNHTNTDH
ncbi:MAG: winged helix-turn-helix domain-containing protein [Anaerolineae bacterium]|nr:winged helix-turn-helix domain-containing protein [Anaerolineae bacterium]